MSKYKRKYLMHLQCQYCGKFFYANRYRKYHTTDCAKLANREGNRMRYRDMRKIVMKARGQIK